MIALRYATKGNDTRPRQTEWQRTRMHGDVLPMVESKRWWLARLLGGRNG